MPSTFLRKVSLPRKPRTRISWRQKMYCRKAQRVIGMLRKRRFHLSLKAKSRRGTIQGGVRWKRQSLPTWGAIFPPGAADIVALFDDEKRFHAGFEKLDAHANAREASAHNEDVNPWESGV